MREIFVCGDKGASKDWVHSLLAQSTGLCDMPTDPSNLGEHVLHFPSPLLLQPLFIQKPAVVCITGMKLNVILCYR